MELGQLSALSGVVMWEPSSNQREMLSWGAMMTKDKAILTGALGEELPTPTPVLSCTHWLPRAD